MNRFLIRILLIAVGFAQAFGSVAMAARCADGQCRCTTDAVALVATPSTGGPLAGKCCCTPFSAGKNRSSCAEKQGPCDNRSEAVTTICQCRCDCLPFSVPSATELSQDDSIRFVGQVCQFGSFIACSAQPRVCLASMQPSVPSVSNAQVLYCCWLI